MCTAQVTSVQYRRSPDSTTERVCCLVWRVCAVQCGVPWCVTSTTTSTSSSRVTSLTRVFLSEYRCSRERNTRSKKSCIRKGLTNKSQRTAPSRFKHTSGLIQNCKPYHSGFLGIWGQTEVEAMQSARLHVSSRTDRVCKLVFARQTAIAIAASSHESSWVSSEIVCNISKGGVGIGA